MIKTQVRLMTKTCVLTVYIVVFLHFSAEMQGLFCLFFKNSSKLLKYYAKR